MSLEEFRKTLTAAFTKVRYETPEGKVYLPTRRVELPPVRNEDEGDGDPDVWTMPAVSFIWDDSMMGSASSISLLGEDLDMIFLCLLHGHERLVFAAAETVEPIGPLVYELIATDGASCGVRLFNSPPSRIENRMPHIFDTDYIQMGFQARFEDDVDWFDFCKSLGSRSPTPVLKSPATIESLPSIVRRFKRTMKKGLGYVADISEAQKRALVDYYFATRYREFRCQACSEVFGQTTDCRARTGKKPVDASLDHGLPLVLASDRCWECGVAEGKAHHKGCSSEICPRCEDRMLRHDLKTTGRIVCP